MKQAGELQGSDTGDNGRRCSRLHKCRPVDIGNLTFGRRQSAKGSRGRGIFTQTEIKAAIKGALGAGMLVGRVEIENGKIIIQGECSRANDVRQPNEWDEV